MNLPNAIWASIIKELLDVGISSSRLAKLAKDVWHKPREEKYADKVIKDTINNNKGSIDKLDIQLLEYTKG